MEGERKRAQTTFDITFVHNSSTLNYEVLTIMSFVLLYFMRFWQSCLLSSCILWGFGNHAFCPLLFYEVLATMPFVLLYFWGFVRTVFYPRGFDSLVFSLSFFIVSVLTHNMRGFCSFSHVPHFCLLNLVYFLARGLMKYRVSFYLTKNLYKVVCSINGSTTTTFFLVFLLSLNFDYSRGD